MLEGFFVFLTMLSINERDFFNTATAQQEQGYKWTELAKCQAPDPNAKSIKITTGTGKELVCFKLVK